MNSTEAIAAAYVKLQQDPSSSLYHHIADNFVHSPSSWKRIFSEASQQKNGPLLRTLRQLIQYQTVTACRKCEYQLLDEENGSVTSFKLEREKLDEPIQQSKYYKNADEMVISTRSHFEKTDIKVVEEDCFLVALQLQKQLPNNSRVAVLNMANAHTPGGGYKAGSGAQDRHLLERGN